MKRLFILALTLLTLACVSDDDPKQGGWCYLHAGLWLASGDTWDEPAGYVDAVFHTYNINELDLIYIVSPSTLTLWDYQDMGARVVVLYPTDAGYHARPMGHHEDIAPYGAYITLIEE